jgi:excisionase family DNA binding protein
MIPGWVKVKEAAKYAGVSERTFEEWLKQGLKFAKIPSGLRLLKPEWIDEFLEQYIYIESGTDQIEKIIDEVFQKNR